MKRDECPKDGHCDRSMTATEASLKSPEIRYLAEKMSYSDIARKLEVPYRTLLQWRNTHMKGKAIHPTGQKKIANLAQAEGYQATKAE